MIKSKILNTFITHMPSLRRMIGQYFIRTEDIEDVLQEAFVRAFAAEKIKNIHYPKAYLHSVARNIALNELSKKSTTTLEFIEEVLGADVESNEPAADDWLHSRLEFEAFGLAVADLPPQCRKVFLLRKICGLTHKEISQKLGISTSTVEKHLAKGLYKCADFMAQKGYGPEELIIVPVSGLPLGKKL
ncbi:MAG: hypothetical protein COB49_04690 [Alphaproteobacteria bacterium]|nr:MAG: hypothetical protein COB49_04690 [Alphaproteobacteria bacterium]